MAHPRRARDRVLSSQSRVATARNRLVVLVTREPVSHFSRLAYNCMSEMSAHLAKRGFTTEIFVCPPGGVRSQCRKVEAFVRKNRVFCCVLVSVGKELQQWFSQHSVPALVFGSCYSSVKLPSLDVDYRSVCRHAAQVFLRQCHRRIAFVVPNSDVAGDLASEQGFKEAFEHRPEKDNARAMIVRHNRSPQDITGKLDALFNATFPPTALLVAHPEHVFAAIMYLLSRSLSVPDSVSLIARDQDYLYDFVSPAISHYQFEPGAFVRRLLRLILKLVSEGDLLREPHLIFPTFIEGCTVKPPPQDPIPPVSRAPAPPARARRSVPAS
mgnify:FL=1